MIMVEPRCECFEKNVRVYNPKRDKQEIQVRVSYNPECPKHGQVGIS